MMRFLHRLFARGAPQIAAAHVRDAAAVAALHGYSFHRGWSEEEVENLLLDPRVLTHRLCMNGRLVGFVMSRSAADEAEILSIAVDRACQGRGFAQKLLDMQMRRLAALGTRAIFLEVAENNPPALRLYRKAGFHEVAKRPNYYPLPDGSTAAALVLRRDIA